MNVHGIVLIGSEQVGVVNERFQIEPDDGLVDCPTCDGTGEVHSHNPKCWTCRGHKRVTAEVAAKAREEEARIERAFPKRTWDYQ